MTNGNIDNLNFKVILDDENFDAQITRDIELAKKLNVQLSALLKVKSQVASKQMVGDATKAAKFQKATSDAAIAQEKLRTATTNTAAAQERYAAAAANAASAQERLKQTQMRTEQLTKRITAQTEKQNKAYAQQSRILNELKGYALGYLSIHGAGQLLSSLVRVTGEFELQKTTLAAMLGDLNKAEQVITKIQGLAVESPFQFKELTTYAKQLSAFSVPAEELYETTKMLADVSAGLGVGMDRIVLAYGQVRSAAFLRGQEVRQFTEAGIPILDELAKQFTEIRGTAVSTAEVFDLISKRMVPFEMVAKIFKDMTSEGGKFFNMQEVQAETLRGKISNLKDAYEVMLNEIGKGQSENLKGAVDWARKLMQNYEQTGRVLVELVAAYGTYKTALIVATNMQSTLARNLVVLRKGFRALTSTLSVNPYAIIAAGVTAAAFGIYKAATHLEEFEKVQKSVTDTANKYHKSLATENAKLDSLYAKLRLAEKGTKEYDEARKQIYTQYASYIAQIKDEKKEVGDLATIYDNLKLKIEEAQKARFRDIASQGIEETYAESTSDLLTKAERKIKGIGKDLGMKFSELETQAFIAYATGSLSEEKIKSDPALQKVADVMARPIFQAVRNIRTAFEEATEAYQNGLKAIDKLYGLATDSSGGKDPFAYPEGEDENSPTKRIQAEIDAVRRLKDAYDTLAPYMNGEMLRKTLTALFPNADQDLIQSLDFRSKLVELAGQLNQFDTEASAKLLDSISGEKASEIAASFKTIEQYKKLLDSWLGEDFTLTGTGVNFDISKIIRDLNNQYSKIDKKAQDASDMLTKAQMGDEEALKVVREVYGEEVWQKYLINGKQTIEELADLERAAARKTADEKIKALADDYVKELMDKQNINLTDFNDKTIGQIDTILKRLGGIRSKIQEELNKIYEGGVTEEEKSRMEMLMEALKQLKIIIDDTDEEKENKIFDNISEGLDAVSDLGGEIESLGEALGHGLLSVLGKEMSDLAKSASDFYEALKADNMIDMIASVTSYVISKITDIVNASYDRWVVLNDAANEYRETMNDIRRESYTGLFGTDALGLSEENAKILAETQAEYDKLLAKVQKNKWQVFGGSFFRKDSVENVLADFLEKEGMSLYDAEGGLNLTALETYFDAYADRLTKKQRKLVEDLIAQGNALDDAALQQAEYLTNLFSSVADNIASGMVDAFIESGDAAMDMGNIISDVSKQMVADLIKSIYLMPILERYQKSFEALQNDTALTPTERAERQLNLLDTALQQIAGQSDDITETIERFEEYLGAGSEGTKDLGEGIKGITEDQANLLASYLNAIRADVSFSKALWVRMDANLQRIAEIFTSSPTLMEYQAQIAANTFNSAQATQQILAELRSVITNDGSDTAIRIYS